MVPEGYRRHLLTDSTRKGADTSVRSTVWSGVDVVVTVLSSRKIYWIVSIFFNLQFVSTPLKKKNSPFFFSIFRLVLFLLASSIDL